MRQRLGVGEVVDGHHVDVVEAALQDGAEGEPSDASESVDAQFGCHVVTKRLDDKEGEERAGSARCESSACANRHQAKARFDTTIFRESKFKGNDARSFCLNCRTKARKDEGTKGRGEVVSA